MTFPLDRPARLAVFASGRGSNLDALLRAFPPDSELASVALVVSNVASALALEKARSAGVATLAHPFPARAHDPAGAGRAQFEAAASEVLAAHRTDLIALAGFMRILSPAFNARWRGRLLNIHPSLLPAFPGLHPQRQALRAGAEVSGCTVHFVDAGVDTGPTILQRQVRVLSGDTEASLGARILQEEHSAYPEALRLVLTGRAQLAQVTP